MTRKEDKYEHAKLWNSATNKVINALDKSDFTTAVSIFQDDFSNILEAPGMEEDSARSMFRAWLIPSFMKDNMRLCEWYVKEHRGSLTKDEEKVLFEGTRSIFGMFRIKDQTKDDITLVDVRGKEFLAETISLPKLTREGIIYARLNSRGNGNYFLSGKFLFLEGRREIFKDKQRVVKFQDSWSNYLTGFFKYLVSEENLTERTADKHESNIELFMMYLENTSVKSFTEITKAMLKTDFKKFVKHNIVQKVDLDNTYYSLYKFFDFLVEAKHIRNEDAMSWLRNRVS